MFSRVNQKMILFEKKEHEFVLGDLFFTFYIFEWVFSASVNRRFFFHYWDEFYCKFSNFHVQKQQLAHLNSQKNVMFVRFFNQRIVLQYESQPFNYLYYIALNLSDWFQNKTSKCCFFFIGRFWTIKNWHANKQTGFSNFIQTIAHAAADWRPCCYVILTEFNFRFERFLDADTWSKKSFYQTK